jgi:hypothetical protein
VTSIEHYATGNHLAWISRNKLKSKLRLKSEILLKFEKSQKNAFLKKNLAQILTQLEKKLKLPPYLPTQYKYI